MRFSDWLDAELIPREISKKCGIRSAAFDLGPRKVQNEARISQIACKSEKFSPWAV